MPWRKTMSDFIKYIKASVLGGALFFSVLPASHADTGVSGTSIIDCSVAGLSEDYKSQVCIPLQNRVDQLLNGIAQPPIPTVMKEALNIQEYRAKGVNAIIKFSKDNNNINSSAGGDEKPKENIYDFFH
jgi:hypothetical protein